VSALVCPDHDGGRDKGGASLDGVMAKNLDKWFA